MPTRRSVLAGGLAAGFATPAGATPPVRGVVELFTSQGCSSCPPADRLAGELARDPSLVVLSLPVDYWDRLGWTDTLAQHAFSIRQRAYAARRGDGAVYTPQAVVSGGDHAVGSDRAGIAGLVGRLPVAVTLATTPAGLVAAIAGPGAGLVLAVSFLRSRTVAIGRGENASTRVTYVNVVRDLRPLGMFSAGSAKFPLGRDPDADMGLAVLVQEGDLASPGRILGAAAL